MAHHDVRQKRITMPPSPELDAKLKASDSEIQQFIIQLKAENLKAQTRIAKLEAQKISNENKITALEKELSRYVESFSHIEKEIPTPTHEDYLRILAEAQSKAQAQK